MSDEPFSIPPVPLMTQAQARNIARDYQGLAQQSCGGGVITEAARLERTGQWWLTYSIALAQTNGRNPNGQ